MFGEQNVANSAFVLHPSAFVSLGTFTGGIIRLISDIRLKHGRGAVNLGGCGRFVLADDLSDIADMTHIDLSGIGSLEGACVRFFFELFVEHSRTLLSRPVR
jgi:hypothetical protein